MYTACVPYNNHDSIKLYIYLILSESVLISNAWFVGVLNYGVFMVSA